MNKLLRLFPKGKDKIGDVLDKMGCVTGGDFNSKLANEDTMLILLWGRCGFTKSLQEIEEDIGYGNVSGSRIKHKCANNLFSFLTEILNK